MNKLILFLSFILFALFISSCSSSRHAVTHRRVKKTQTRKLPRENDKVYAQVRDEVIIHALKHVGKNYKYGGKNPASGFDCSGLISYAFSKAGINVKGASHQQSRMGSWKPMADLEIGDLVFFGKNKKVSHVALVIKNKDGKIEVIHSTSSSGVRIDEISDSPYWMRRYLFGRDVISETETYVSRR
jgi:cell wall-associated NlpC family hydrolase